MKRNLFLSLAFLLPFSLAAQKLTDTTISESHRFSVTILIGQANRINGADYSSVDGPFSYIRGVLTSQSLATGAMFRYYTNESCAFHARFAYSYRYYSMYDTITADPYYVNDGVISGTDGSYFELTDNFKMNNMLIGLGASYETHLRKLILRVGAELNYIQYTKLTYSRTYKTTDTWHADTLATGGSYDYSLVRTFDGSYNGPQFWAAGITGNATIEYTLTKRIGIGMSLYLGGYYAGLSKKNWHYESVSHTIETDSNGMNYDYTYTDDMDFEYSTKQFDFSPLNAQFIVVYYFGK